MYTEHVVRIVAGTLVMAGVILGRFVNPWWLLLPLFVGANLFQSVLTKLCPMEIILRKCGMKGCLAPERKPEAEEEA